MGIVRSGEVPLFCNYATDYALADPTGLAWPKTVDELSPHSVLIPQYKRIITWSKKEIEWLLKTNSCLLGTVTLASIHHNPYNMMDGLQRLATATAILNYLYSDAIRQKINNKNIKRLDTEIGRRLVIIRHNDKMFRKLRPAMSKSYKRLYEDVKSIIDSKLGKDGFMTTLIELFTIKQITVDMYTNFKNENDMILSFMTPLPKDY